MMPSDDANKESGKESWLTRKDVFLLILGAVLGGIVGLGFNFLVPAVSSTYDEVWCHASSRMTEAQQLNRQARGLLAGGDRVAANQRFSEANGIFEVLHKCGIAGGSAQLGLNKCHGFGYSLVRNEQDGIVLLRTAAARDPFFRDWVDDRTICFGVKGVKPASP